LACIHALKRSKPTHRWVSSVLSETEMGGHFKNEGSAWLCLPSFPSLYIDDGWFGCLWLWLLLHYRERRFSLRQTATRWLCPYVSSWLRLLAQSSRLQLKFYANTCPI